MKRSLKQKIAAGAAIAVVLAGGTLAAVTAAGEGPLRSAKSTSHRGGGGRDLSTAAGYLGVTQAQLRSDLHSGKTLAQVANATSGKSAAGLLGALVAAKKARLAAATATLTHRVTAEINRTGGPALRKRRAHRPQGLVRVTAASYLGLTAAQLKSDLHSGKTLALLADATSGKSAAGLIAALVAAKKEGLAAAAARGRLTQAKETALAAKLNERVTRLVNRTHRVVNRAPKKGRSR